MNLIDLKEMLKKLNISRSSMYKKIDMGLWPKPIKIAPRTNRWMSQEIDQMILILASGASQEQIKMKVESIHTSRQKN